jgi:dTDP-4-dehydrorhamnose reductase
LTEEAETQPINVYGSTKRAGELACLEANPDAIIIRTLGFTAGLEIIL